MRIYLAVLHQQGDSAFGIEFPDLPGCFAAADRIVNVLDAARQALDLWFEDADPVERRSLPAMHAAVADQLTEGGILIAVPY